ncbi:MAG: superoxide dismutase family protein [Acidimicrobiales bacterium]
MQTVIGRAIVKARGSPIRLALVLCLIGLSLAAPADAGRRRVERVPLADLSVDADPFDGAEASFRAKNLGNRRLRVTLNVHDIDATGGQEFGAHVHVGPCVPGDGGVAGPHYNDGGAPSPRTEVWFRVRSLGKPGTARSSYTANVPFTVLPENAKSIVIHALPTDENGDAGPRLACLDFRPPVRGETTFSTRDPND